MVSFDQVDAALRHADMQAAEAHGMLIGMACAAGQVTVQDWWVHVFEPSDDISGQPDRPEVVDSMYSEAMDSLLDATGNFDLMLPDDEEALELRADALHEWCHGFLYGYGVAGGRDIALLPVEAAELLRDVTQFAQARFDLGEDAEEDELSYSELVEYVRVGVMLLFETLYPRAQPKPEAMPDLDEDEPLDIEALWSQIAKAKAQTLH
ncbi:MAG: UPF0149 family protein [Halothiobacillaceae bacterium]|nr:UPF0149 family protein [Halothiobacillaceae bacterium]